MAAEAVPAGPLAAEAVPAGPLAAGAPSAVEAVPAAEGEAAAAGRHCPAVPKTGINESVPVIPRYHGDVF